MARSRGTGTLGRKKPPNQGSSINTPPRRVASPVQRTQSVAGQQGRSYSPPKRVRTNTAPVTRSTNTRSSGGGSRGYTNLSASSGGGSYSGGGSGGGYSAASAPPPAAPAPPPPPPPPPRWEDLGAQAQKDYLNSDATYMAQQGSLQQELENLIAELALQRKNYGAEHNNTLRNLGWSQELNAFDPNNDLGAYGMAYENTQNDFAGRGMLDSSAFAEGLNNLNTSFNNQLSDINNAKSRFEGELSTREQGARESHTADINRARADAIARRAARLGLV